MPAFTYVCQSCQNSEQRISGISDGTVKCDHCDGTMTRLTEPEEILRSYSRKFVAAS